MRFSNDFLASLREWVPLSSLVGRAVTYDKRKSQPGRGDFWACCPFHHEKTPSFHVDDRKGFYHCFGCQASGDHLTFLTEHDGLPFPDAVKALADVAGIALPEPDRAEPAGFSERRTERRALEAAAQVFATLFGAAAGRAARAYAERRGLSAQTLETFGFGLAPSAPTALLRNLTEMGFEPALVERAGLALRRDDGSLRDRFRARLMVPIHDARGMVVGFGGRTLDGHEPKYLNSPQSAVFDKSALLFNAHRARGPAHRTGRLLITEGYMDAIALAQVGIGEVVASLGTALTETQIQKAWAMADEPVLCFDGDKAGRAAAWRAMDRIVPALAVGRSFQFVTLPEGDDPDDVVRNGGRAALEGLIEKARPLVDALFDREVARGTDTPERMAALETRLEAIANSIKDARLGRLYRSAFRERCFELRRAAPLRTGFAPHSRRRPIEPPIAAPADARAATVEMERTLLGLLIHRPQLIDRFSERLATMVFTSEAHEGFAGLLVECADASQPERAEELLAALPERARLVLPEIWGEPVPTVAGVGTKLMERFGILRCDPDDAFLTRCVSLFLDRLALNAEINELSEAPAHLASPQSEGRLLSMSQAIAAQTARLADEERWLADAAAALRRRSSGMEPNAPQ